MWSDRLSRLIAAAARTRRADTSFILHVGDLIQGDCTDYDIQMKMLKDAQSACAKGFGDLPFVFAYGNHDVRSGGDQAVDDFVRPRDEEHDGCRQKRTQEEILALQDEYRPGLVEYRKYRAAGHYLMRVFKRGVAVDFYACDSLSPTETFVLHSRQ